TESSSLGRAPLSLVSCVSRLSSLESRACLLSLFSLSVSVSDPSLAVSVARRPRPPPTHTTHGDKVPTGRSRPPPTSRVTSNLYQRFTNLIQLCANLAQSFPALSPSAASLLPSYFNGDINGDDARWRNRIRLIARLS
ncbi:hypothetical protein E4U47_001437, partial [Claviceps purpurea]